MGNYKICSVVAACSLCTECRAACDVLSVVHRASRMLHGTQYTHHNLKHMLLQHCITYNDVSLLFMSTKV